MTAVPRRDGAADRCSVGLAWLVVTSAVVIAGCATGRHGDRAAGQAPAGSGERSLPFFERDGPDPHPPDGLALVPDAEPRIEPIRSGGPNKPYEALGLSYVPLLEDRPYTERGLATWYGRKFHGHRTSSGEPYDMYAMTAAHPVLPIPSYARVRNPANGREVVVRINDRGPFHSGRIIDLSYTAALKLGVLRGATQVEVQHITGDDIRTGAWRTPAASTAVATAAQSQSLAMQAAVLQTPQSTPQPAAPPNPQPTAQPNPQSTVLPTAPPPSRSIALTALPTGPAATLPPPGPSTTPGPDMTGASLPSNPAALSAPLAVAGAVPTLVDPAPADRATVGTSSPVASQTAMLVPIEGPSEMVPTAPLDSAGSRLVATTPVSPQAEPTVAQPAGTTPTWWLQLGAFHQRDAADRLSQDVASGARWLAPLLAVAADARWFRLQAGPYATVADARGAAERLRRDLQLTTMIVPRP